METETLSFLPSLMGEGAQSAGEGIMSKYIACPLQTRGDAKAEEKP